MKMEQTECSEKSAYKIQTPGNYPEENNIQKTAKVWNQEQYIVSAFLSRCRWLNMPKVVFLADEVTCVHFHTHSHCAVSIWRWALLKTHSFAAQHSL